MNSKKHKEDQKKIKLISNDKKQPKPNKTNKILKDDCNFLLNKLSKITDFLDTYYGRDNFVKLFQHITLVIVDLFSYYLPFSE